jgi:peptidyl-prolyl cis-trans isomerase C
VIALALAPLLAAGCGGGDGERGSAVVARVAGRRITEADLDARIAQVPQLAQPEYGTPAGRARLLHQMIEEEVLYRAARDERLDRDPDVRRRLDDASRQILVQSYLDRAQQRMAAVGEGEAADFYERHKDEYRTEAMVRVRLLVTDDRAVAERVRARAQAGQPFDTLCKQFSSDPVAAEAGGLLPAWVRRDRAVPWLGNHPAFHEVVFGLAAGAVSEVFQTPRGFHVAKLEEKREERQRPFEEVRADIEARLARERSAKGLPELLESLKGRYRVEMAEPPGRSAEELFTQAQQTTDPRARIPLWEELIDRYPEDARVVEALFMIGFTKAEELGDRAGAEIAFRRVIEEFPDSELAQSARWMLTSGGDEVPNFGEAPPESAAAEAKVP